MVASERASWRNPRVLATLLLVFTCGAIIGALSMRSSVHESIHRRAGSSIWGGGGRQVDMSYEKLKTELNLTPEQAGQLKSILEDFETYQTHLQEQIEDWRATGKNRIISILTPGQRKQFEKLCAR
jgi:Spy/CpxP family protein refolding chaperone